MSAKLVKKDPSPSGSESDAAGSDNPLLSKTDKWDTEVKESKKFFRKKVNFQHPCKEAQAYCSMQMT